MKTTATTFANLVVAYGLTAISLPTLGTIEVCEVRIDTRNAVISERPGDGMTVELEDFPVMTIAPATAALLERRMQQFSFETVLIALVRNTMHVVAIDIDGIHTDGQDGLFDLDLPLAA